MAYEEDSDVKSKTTMDTQTGGSDPADNKGSLNQPTPYPKEVYAWLVVGILMVVYIFSFMDRLVLSLLVDPIKADLGISDSQISYLGGFAFALFYTVFGIPIARLADSKNRKVIISAGLAVWSLFTMACGTANQFLSFAIYRMGVGVGEATLSPSAYSMISDLFRPDRLAVAISIYSAGIYIGSGLATLFGGLVVGYVGGIENLSLPFIGPIEAWQYVFFAIGFPGLLFTLVMLCVKEPARRGIVRKNAKSTSVPLGEVIAYMRANRRTIFYHNAGFALIAFISNGAGFWIPSLLIRVHGLTPQEVGIAWGSIVIVFGTVGIISGGFLATWLGKKGYKDSKMRVGVIAAAAHIPLGIAYTIMPNAPLTLLLLCPAVFTSSMPIGCAAAAIQEMMPNRMRAQASAIYLFVVNIIGLGVGPSAVAWFTDYVYHDTQKVNLSLLWISTIFGIGAVILLYRGMRHFRGSLDHLEQYQRG